MDKDLKILLQKLAAQSWEERRTKKGLYAVPPDPSKPMVLIHLTPSDRRAWKNMMAQLKRSGFKE
ncbi:hypothetical protein [Microbacterium excoecariae]|uniref:hypothetical protein n=1 Tax=Microbacterium excoecariae TaxID=2715210 RepID=UPI0014088A48|nr:hypothetical protein [Microbacterium excoecariae]NHI16881.1 hypothetical protein [Microbacterium excoecariae]